MKGWTLDTVRDLDVEDYDEILSWLNDEATRAEHPDSMDVDAVIEAKAAKERSASGDE
jgi:ribosome-associated toxin RatA of RatAB toxin-antitoxin module